MSKRVVKLILVLVSMLFLNIEAAQAGLVGKLKLLISAELPPQQLTAATICVSVLAVIAYIIFTPIRINNERWPWYDYFRFQPESTSYRKRRIVVKRINKVLRQRDPS